MILLTNPARIFAIVPAAGRSRRMGTAKALLHIAGQPMLLHILHTLRTAGTNHIALVLNPDLHAALTDLPQYVQVIINDDPNSEMIDSIRLGLDGCLKSATTPPSPGTPGEGRGEGSPHPPPKPNPPTPANQPSHNDGILVCPCDAAGITTDDIRRCIHAFTQTPDRIIIPTHNDRPGHPIIFPAALAPAVHSPECNTGLNHLPRNRPHLVRHIKCSPGTTRNINTPAEYQTIAESNDQPLP